ncbi:MAG: SWIB/MDM2 domain-containing protein [Planctomycetota bacterium]
MAKAKAKAPKKAAKPAKAKAPKKAGAKKGRGGAGNAAFMKPVQPDDLLSAIVGDKPIPRTEITKRVWAYIKKNGCQDGRNINADENLKKVFNGKSKVTMFEMTSLVNKHLKG